MGDQIETLILSHSPAGYWRFNGGLTDSSGNSLTLSVGAGSELYRGGLIRSTNNESFSFNGSTYLSRADSSLLEPAAITVGCWIQTAENDIRYLAHKIDTAGPNQGWVLGINTPGEGGTQASGTICFWSGTAWRSVSLGGAGVISDGLPHLIAATNNGTTTRLYWDGVDVGGGSATLATSNAVAMQVGRNPFDTLLYPGRMDELFVLPSALTASRMLALYTAGAAQYTGTRRVGVNP